MIRLLLPVSMRGALMVSWLKVLASPAWRLYGLFLKWRLDNLYYLNHTSQVVYMEGALNDRRDKLLRRITIVDGLDTTPPYLYKREELKPPVFVYTRPENTPVHLYTRGEMGLGFKVLIPAAVVFDDKEMRALIELYKLPGMTYKIVIV